MQTPVTLTKPSICPVCLSEACSPIRLMASLIACRVRISPAPQVPLHRQCCAFRPRSHDLAHCMPLQHSKQYQCMCRATSQQQQHLQQQKQRQPLIRLDPTAGGTKLNDVGRNEGLNHAAATASQDHFKESSWWLLWQRVVDGAALTALVTALVCTLSDIQQLSSAFAQCAA